MSDYTEDWHGWEAREEAESRTRGEAMSTADDAYDEWRETWKYPKPVPQIEAAFMAGYRRALEDAADALDAAWLAGTIYSGLDAGRIVDDLAAGVGTKDGNDDE